MDFRLIAKLLSVLCGIFSVGVLLPLVTAMCVDTENVPNFLTAFIVSCILGLVLRHYGVSRNNQKLRIREAFVLLTFGWTMICVLGTIPYAMLESMDLVTSFFECVAAFTTTGISSVASYDIFPPSILVWRGLSHWCGALGVIMLFIIVMPQMNSGASQLFNAELPSVLSDRTLPKIKESAFLVFKIYTSLFWLEVFLLMIFGTPFLQAINMALASMSTGGFSFYYQGEYFAFDNLSMGVICLAFMLIGSINFSLYYKFWRGDWHAIKDDVEHRYYLLWIFIAGTIIALDLYIEGFYNIDIALQQGYMHAISVGSTTGFSFADFEKWPGISRLVLFLMLFVGGCSGSAAGGIKVSRIVILLKASWAELMRTLHPNMVYSLKLGGKLIAPEMVRNVTRFFFMYLFVYIVLTILVSLSGMSIVDSMSLIATCLSSAGVLGSSTMASIEFSSYAKIISVIAMLLGRLEIFAFLVVLSPDFWRNKTNW